MTFPSCCRTVVTLGGGTGGVDINFAADWQVTIPEPSSIAIFVFASACWRCAYGTRLNFAAATRKSRGRAAQEKERDAVPIGGMP